MNEFRPLRVVPVHQTEVVSIVDFHPFTANFMKPEDLAAVVAELQGTDLSNASLAAESSWSAALVGTRYRIIAQLLII